MASDRKSESSNLPWSSIAPLRVSTSDRTSFFRVVNLNTPLAAALHGKIGSLGSRFGFNSCAEAMAVFTMMMPAWFGERGLGKILRLPPMPRAPVETRTVTLDELLKLQPKSDSDEI